MTEQIMAEQTFSYRTIAEVLDFGPYITKVILMPGESPAGASPRPEQFRVWVQRKLRGQNAQEAVLVGERAQLPMEGERRVTAAYVSDDEGRAEPQGEYITLELECDPRDGLGSIMCFDGRFNVFVDVAYTITMEKPLRTAAGTIPPCVFDKNSGSRLLLGELLREARHEDAELSLRYSYYEPSPEADGKAPLLIWLHGLGEGGEDTKIAAVANKVVNLISPEIQKIFGGKAYLLVPQAPTWWMDPGDGVQQADDGRSIYIGPLRRLIEDFLALHPNVDKNRVYLGGDSNGGYMTVNMVIHYPELFAAAFPVCECYRDTAISQEQLERLARVPLWFTAARNDKVVPVEQYVVPTYQRLRAMGAEVHLTLWDKVEDKTGRWRKEDGTPYEYDGHCSWIPMLNNENGVDYNSQPVRMDGREVSLLEWVAGKKKDRRHL